MYDVKAGTYARINQTDGISAIDDSITIDNILDSNEIPASGFFYLGNPSGQLKREKAYYSNYSGGTFSGITRGINGTAPTKWSDNTIVEIVASVELTNAPADNADVFVGYSYSSDAVDRSRNVLQYASTQDVIFLDETDSANEGWSTNDPDLVGYWTMDGNFRDYSGSGNDGTWTDANSSGQSFSNGKYNQAVGFDGTDDYIATPLNQNSEAATFGLWLKANDVVADQYVISQDVNNANCGDFILDLGQTNNNRLTAGFDRRGCTENDWFSLTSGTISTNQWYFVTVTMDASATKLFVNGEEVASGKPFTYLGDSAGTVDIGSYRNSAAGVAYDGLLDDVFILSRALSAEEVAKAYSQGISKYSKNTSVAGQTAIAKLRGTDISAMLNQSMETGGVSQFIIDEGTASEKSILVDTSKENSLEDIQVLSTSLSDDLHTVRLVANIAEGRKSDATKTSLSAWQTNGHAPILKPAASSEIIYEEPLADLNPETSGEGKTNDVFYWDTRQPGVTSSSLKDQRTNLITNLNTTQTAMIVENVEHFPASGVVQIGDEQIKYNTKASDGITGKLLNLERGYNDTTATNHLVSEHEEILSGISGSIGSIYLYDTAKDNIDNAWRFDQTKSWYTESSSELRCPNGYQDSGAQKCTRAFPEVAVIVGSARLYIYDAESKELWMSFRGTNFGPYFTGDSGKQVTGGYAKDGKIFISARQDGGNEVYGGYVMIDLIEELSLKNEQSSNFSGWYGPIDERNADDNNSAQRLSTDNIPSIVNYDVNDVHAAVIDGKTYVVVATDGGVSVINEDEGTVVDYWANANCRPEDYVHLTSEGTLYSDYKCDGWGENSAFVANYEIQNHTEDQISNYWDVRYLGQDFGSIQEDVILNTAISTKGITSIDVTEGASPFGGNTLYIGTDNGVSIIQENQGDESNGSVKYISSDYVTEEMVGDIRGMWTFDGLGAGGELASNGTFTDWTGALPDNWTQRGTPDGSNYTANSSGQLSLVSNRADGSFGVTQDLGLVAGHKYSVSFDLTVNSGGVHIYGDLGNGGTPQSQIYTTSGTKAFEFTYTDYGYDFGITNSSTSTNVLLDNLTVTEIAIDNSAKTNDLTNNGGVTFTNDGVRGKAASFDGATQYLDIADNSELSLTGEFSLGAWFKTDSLAGDHAIITKYNNSATQYSYNLQQSGTEVRFVACEDTLCNTYVSLVTSGLGLQTDTWYQVTGVYDGTYTHIYVNGEHQITSNTTISGVADSTANFTIGRYGYAVNYFD